MTRLFAAVCLAGSLLLSPRAAVGQERTTDLDTLRKEVDLLKRELDLLKRENELLKKENESLKKGGSAKAADGDPDAGRRVTVDKVEYQYEGLTRSGGKVTVTVLATSKDGNRPGPNGSMVLIDPDGEKYTGKPSQGFGTQPALREGVPVKLMWQFGGSNPLGLAGPPAPSAKIMRFAAVIVHRTVANSDDDTIDFRDVPAEVTKSKGK